MRLGRITVVVVSGLLLSNTGYADDRLNVVPLVNESQRVLVPATLGIIINKNDPQSIELGRMYAEVRGIPTKNIIELQLPNVNFVARHLMVRELARLKSWEEYDHISAFALAFDRPYRVDTNQSITSAIAEGIDTMTWRGDCNLTRRNLDAGAAPGAPLKTKPAMVLFGGGDVGDTVALAQRGKFADATDPSGDVYLVKTLDRARSGPREASMDRAENNLGGEIEISVLNQNDSAYRANVVGYQTGLPVVENLDTLSFVPGAFADHLTSFGGALGDKKKQTLASAFVRAGATASFGTVREPCNYTGKFPDPERLLSNYLRGDTIIEAYWKSVDMASEGLFIGEPLARPFPVVEAKRTKDGVVLTANRHTGPFIVRDTKTSVGEDVYIAVYDVTGGSPNFLKRFPVDRHVGEGKTIGVIDDEQIAVPDIVLGVIREN